MHSQSAARVGNDSPPDGLPVGRAERVARRSERTFDTWLRSVAPRLQRALIARYGTELGSEAAADAVAYAWEHRTELFEMGNPIGYLYRVGQTSVRRSLRRRRRLDLPPEPPPDAYAAVEPIAPALPDALAELPESQRVAVVLVYAFGYSYADAAELLDAPVSTIRNHLHRGMRRLRRLLEYPDDQA